MCLSFIFVNLTVTPFLMFTKITVPNEEVYARSFFSKEDALAAKEEMLQQFREMYPNDVISAKNSWLDYPYIGYKLDENGTLRGYIVVWIYRTYSYCKINIMVIPWIVILNIIILQVIADPIAIFYPSIHEMFKKPARHLEGIHCIFINCQVFMSEMETSRSL